MRPLRLLLSLGSSLIALTLLLYVAFGSQKQDQLRTTSLKSSLAGKGKVKAFFSFTSPASLFPPSAIISLTDDNSTFFLARPAAFGPLLPANGLSGPLWVGSGFGDETMGRGELGCSDVPGWSDGNDNPLVDYEAALGSKGLASEKSGSARGATRIRRTASEEDAGSRKIAEEDGTDDHLQPVQGSELSKSLRAKTSEHADIQSLQEGAEIAGKVVLLKRGGCGFLEKAKWSQRRGGVALIVGDDVRGGPLIVMHARGDTSDIVIPSLFTSHTTAHLLSSLQPSGGFMQDLSPEYAAKLELIKSGKGAKQGKSKNKTGKAKASGSRPTFTKSANEATSVPQVNKEAAAQFGGSEGASWLRSFLYALGFRNPVRTTSKTDGKRPRFDWNQIETWEDEQSNQKHLQTNTATTTYFAPTQASDDFVIGEQDWRDPDLLPQQTSTALQPHESPKPKKEIDIGRRGDSFIPGSGEYNKESLTRNSRRNGNDVDGKHTGWLSKITYHRKGDAVDTGSKHAHGSDSPSSPLDASSDDDEEKEPDEPEQHEGLWVTLAPSNMSSSPFFDTLLVLVVSPLVTLSVVYALLFLRARIRRRRWRAPKSVVERLPVRTYHTISDASSSPTASPTTSSPTTPLLQHSSSRPNSQPSSSFSRPVSQTTPEVPATSSATQQGSQPTEEEKREAGLAEWRRRYGGRQKECVVCLEEYVDGISRVMSLPCGHEFHADCITPWLVTRRRTCPICKGDVVRCLSQSYRDRGLRSPSPERLSRFLDDPDELQVQAAETRNDSPSASRPVPISSSSAADYSDDFDADVEANWADDNTEQHEEQGRDIPGDHAVDLSSSMRDLSSTVSTTIWRGFDAVRNAAGLQRRPSQGDVDRDR